jgi:hypothetical protein
MRSVIRSKDLNKLYLKEQVDELFQAVSTNIVYERPINIETYKHALLYDRNRLS